MEAGGAGVLAFFCAVCSAIDFLDDPLTGDVPFASSLGVLGDLADMAFWDCMDSWADLADTGELDEQLELVTRNGLAALLRQRMRTAVRIMSASRKAQLNKRKYFL